MNGTSIIIPTWNEIEKLRSCIQSIRNHTTDTPYEIIVVDNGSTDGTLEFLLGESVSFVSLPHTRRLPAVCNAGLKIAKGSSLLLLNHGAVVSRNWLTDMLSCLHQSEDIGIVSPFTHFAGEEQLENEFEKIQRHLGICFLLKREVMDKIGLLNETTAHPSFDSDYLQRARLAGYRLLTDQGTFVFHFGGSGSGTSKFTEPEGWTQP